MNNIKLEVLLVLPLVPLVPHLLLVLRHHHPHLHHKGLLLLLGRII
jgi:hypothetical protein